MLSRLFHTITILLLKKCLRSKYKAYVLIAFMYITSSVRNMKQIEFNC